MFGLLLIFFVLTDASVYFLYKEVNTSSGQKMPGCNKLPGDYTGGEMPDPIPNSEAKSVRPMVVLTGESRLLPGFLRACT